MNSQAGHLFGSDDNAPLKMDKYDCPNSLNFLENPETSLNLIGEPDERFETFNDIKPVKHVRIHILEKRGKHCVRP